MKTTDKYVEERERTPSRHIDRLRKVVMLQATRIYIIPDINNMEILADSRGTGKGLPK